MLYVSFTQKKFGYEQAQKLLARMKARDFKPADLPMMVEMITAVVDIPNTAAAEAKVIAQSERYNARMLRSESNLVANDAAEGIAKWEARVEAFVAWLQKTVDAVVKSYESFAEGRKSSISQAARTKVASLERDARKATAMADSAFEVARLF